MGSDQSKCNEDRRKNICRTPVDSGKGKIIFP